MIEKKTGLRKPKLANRRQHKDTRQEENKCQLKSTGNSKSQFSRVKIEEYLASITRKEHLPFSHLVHSNRVSKLEIFKHIYSCFMGITETRILKELTTMIGNHSVFLPTELPTGKKTLFLDLDETLIHTTLFPSINNYGTVKISLDGILQTIYFNLRPYCYEFLNSISKLYEIYIFTAAEAVYAEAMMGFLNKENTTITGCLSRQSCLKTSAGYYVKDLRIIKNRNANDMLLIDNLTLSFGQTIYNGIPILEFTNNQEDSELIHLQKYLQNIINQIDVRETNKEKWRLGEIETMDAILKNILQQN